MTQALDAAIHATENFIYKLEGEARSIAEVALRAALPAEPAPGMIEALEDAVWGSCADEDAVSAAASAVYRALRAHILGE